MFVLGDVLFVCMEVWIDLIDDDGGVFLCLWLYLICFDVFDLVDWVCW